MSDRCDRCGWPLAGNRNVGCVAGDCSERPLPPLRTPAPVRQEGLQLVGHQYAFSNPVTGHVVWRDSHAPWNGQNPSASREIFAPSLTPLTIPEPIVKNPAETVQDDSCPQCGTNDLCGCGQDDGRALAKIQEARTRKLFDGGEIHVPLNKNELAVIEAALTRPVAGDATQQDPMLLEVLNFINKVATLKIITGGEFSGVLERRELREDAEALYAKLAAIKWGVPVPAIPPEVISRVVGALEPFANYACHEAHVGEPDCHNCEAREALAALKPYSGGA